MENKNKFPIIIAALVVVAILVIIVLIFSSKSHKIKNLEKFTAKVEQEYQNYSQSELDKAQASFEKYVAKVEKKELTGEETSHVNELKADYIVVMPHWGIEYERKQNKEQKGYANYMYECGADMVIGGHPHVVQPITLKNRNEYGVYQQLTAYSLGNFVSNQRKRFTDGGIIIKCEMVRGTNGVIRISDYEYLPYWVYKGTCQGKYQYHILPAKHAVENCADYDIHGADSVALNLFYNDTKSLIDNVPESKFAFTSSTR